MLRLQETKGKVFYYLSDAVNSYFDKHLKCPEKIKHVNQIRFTLVKRGKTASEIQIHFINKVPIHIISDEDGFLKKRMENFFKFESDVEFVAILLYFVCKHYGIDFAVVSDKIFEDKVRTITTDTSKKESGEELLKYIYFDLKPI
jgi:hypothetical protein